MTISMYKVSVPIFVQLLTALSAVLGKAAAHAEAKQIDPAFLLGMRLYPDMYPLVRQVQQATAHPIRACSALAGSEALSLPNTETSFAELEMRDEAVEARVLREHQRLVCRRHFLQQLDQTLQLS